MDSNCTNNSSYNKSNIQIILDSVADLKLGLTTKQKYLTEGIQPLNLPYSIFLKEDIDQLDYIENLLKSLK